MYEGSTTRQWFKGLRNIWQWAKTHKVKALFAAFTLFICVELLTIPWFSVTNLKTENPTETALMRQRLREAEQNEKPLVIKNKWVSISRLPRHLINAVVLAEDGTFWEHGGFDWYEFQQSLKKNWEKKRAARGASTITQQLAKNLYLSTSKDPIRKLKEWVITLLLERNLEKQRILELYLNVIEWGRGIFGVEEAARAYFGRSASALTYDQALRLAAVIPSPLKHKPTDGSRWVMYRKRVVAQRMLGRKYYEAEPEPDEDDEEQIIPSQSKETESSQPRLEASPADTGKVSTPQDSTDFMEGNGNDIQRWFQP
jgi:monofunctional biosynthetic peptidoglycan transglycosylase